MKKQSMTKKLLGGVMSLLFLFSVAGCSDGEHPGMGKAEENPSVSATPPIVDFFGANTEDGKEVTINSGESISLMWSVQNASRIEITSAGSNTKFSYTTETELAGKATVDAGVITETTTFVLTAYPKEGTAEGDAGATPIAAGSAVKETGSENLPGATESPETVGPVTAQVQVIVRPATAIDVKFEPNDPSIIASTDGSYSVSPDGVVLHWVVTPAESVVALSASPELQPILVDCASGEELEATETYPSEGCAKVYPTENTTVTLTATLGDLAPATKEIQLAVNKSPNIESLSITGPDGSNAVDGGKIRVASYPAKVTLAWKVSPMNAKVTINSETAEVEGSREVEVTGDTTFTLTAVANGEEKTGTVGVEIDKGAFDCDAQTSVTTSSANAPVFAGETVKLSWTLSGAAAAIIKTVEIKGHTSGIIATKEAAVYSIDLQAQSDAYDISFKNAAGKEECHKPVSIAVSSAFESLDGGKATRVAVNGGDAYVGFDEVSFTDPAKAVDESTASIKIKTTHFSADGHEEMYIDFFQTISKLGYRFLKDKIKTFPVNAITVASDGHVFVGTTGAIFHQAADGGWAALPPLLRTDKNQKYSGSHATCFGKTQTGLSGKENNGKVATMNQVCDILVTTDGKFYIAHDRGVYAVDSVAKVTSGKMKESDVQGKSDKSGLYKSVVNDLVEVADGVVAGGAKGVYKSVDGGASWTSLNGGELSEGTAVNSVEVTAGVENYLLVVGTDKGVYTNGESAWKKSAGLDGKVYSVAVDPSNHLVIYAGAETGFYVSRDGGANFSAVVEGAVVRSIAISSSEKEKSIYLATESGVKRAKISLGTGEVIREESAEETPAEGVSSAGVTPGA